MTEPPPPKSSLRHRIRARTVLGRALAGLLLAGAMGCEDRAIGRVCDVQADAGSLQAVYNPQALECPTRICLKPARDIMKSGGLIDTAPYCSGECSKDSDCEGEKRTSSMLDKRCRTGFVCGVAFEVGQLCCKKLCLCKDFVTIPKGGLTTPSSCNKSTGVSTCQNL